MWNYNKIEALPVKPLTILFDGSFTDIRGNQFDSAGNTRVWRKLDRFNKIQNSSANKLGYVRLGYIRLGSIWIGLLGYVNLC